MASTRFDFIVPHTDHGGFNSIAEIIKLVCAEGDQMNVWCVEIDYVILAIFAHEKDAKNFFDMVDDGNVSGSMYPRTLHYGQPANQGYNK